MTPVEKARMTHTAAGENRRYQYELTFSLIQIWVAMYRNIYRAALRASGAVSYHADVAKSKNCIMILILINTQKGVKSEQSTSNPHVLISLKFSQSEASGWSHRAPA